MQSPYLSSFREPKNVSHPNAVRRKPPLLHFKGVEDRPRRRMGLQGEGFHIHNPYDLSLSVDESDAQGDEGIFHPEAVVIFRFEDEEHPLIFAQLFPAHQPLSPLLRGLWHFHPDLSVLQIDRNFQKPLGVGERGQHDQDEGGPLNL